MMIGREVTYVVIKQEMLDTVIQARKAIPPDKGVR